MEVVFCHMCSYVVFRVGPKKNNMGKYLILLWYIKMQLDNGFIICT